MSGLIWPSQNLIIRIAGSCGTLENLILIREFVIVENIRLVCLLDLTADFGVKTNAKLTPIFELREKSKTGIQSCLYTVALTIFALIFRRIFSIMQFLWLSQVDLFVTQ